MHNTMYPNIVYSSIINNKCFLKKSNIINKNNYIYPLIKNNNLIYTNYICIYNNYNDFFLKSILDQSKSIYNMFYDSYNFFLKKYSNYDINFLYVNLFKEKVLQDSLMVNSIKNILKKNNMRASEKKPKFLKKASAIDFFLKKYIENYIESKVIINFDKYNIIFFKKKNIFINALRRKLRRMKKSIKLADLSIRNFIRITIIFLYTKDIDIFTKVLLKILNAMHYKNHRKFLYLLKLFITKTTNYFYDLFKFSGFFFLLSGKISGGGNSKKKRYAIRCGKYSLTHKMLKIKYKKGLIYTKTGVLGFKFIISYN